MNAPSNRLNRRTLVKRSAAIGSGIATAGVIGGTPRLAAASRQDQAAEDGSHGGRLKVAIVGEPPTLDEHQTTAIIVADVTYPMYETLFSYDETFQPVPELAETHQVSSDGLTHTIALRQDVVFHNGEPMTATDVHASIMRWAELSGVGGNLFESVDELAIVDDYTIEFRLTQPFGPLLIALSHNTQACTIHPKSVLDQAGTEPITDDSLLVGTGPYQFSERQADAYIRLARFEGYASRAESPSGYAGAKFAYVDEIEFIPVPNEASRVAGLQAGDYDMAHDITNDQYEVLSNSPGVVAEILPPSKFETFFLNWRSPLMSDLNIRQAFQAALDHEVILTASQGSSEFFVLDPGWMMQQSAWYTEAGSEFYNVNDPDLAQQKLEEAGYDGTPLRFLTSQERPTYFNASVLAQQQLEAVGFTVEMITVDWATLFDLRSQEGEWDAFVTGHGFVPDPSQLTLIGQMGVYPGWWDSEESQGLAEELLRQSDFESGYAIWEELQNKIYTEIPAIKLGDVAQASYYSEAVNGWVGQADRGIPYWNLWLAT